MRRLDQKGMSVLEGLFVGGRTLSRAFLVRTVFGLGSTHAVNARQSGLHGLIGTPLQGHFLRGSDGIGAGGP